MASAVDNFFSLDFEESQYFINHYKDLLNIEIKSLMAEMIVAQNSLKTLNQKFDIQDLKKSVEKHVYPNLYKLLQVALTLPISSATWERSFSALRKIKTWLRVSMGQERMTDLSILYIEKDLTNKIDTKEVIRIFAQTERRIMLE
ncbi:unnamed protein product [Macrosiphum euphorbiae]|uniref:HAT C-terminal dimerisation domain-containing protein n=1 Tax=Macrosiphum euphorbiae TaxID=13131 RepID=A0AAV0XJG3_9HEMI|nr:unnamed protein product [Macrosiphum euphorbiae]